MSRAVRTLVVFLAALGLAVGAWSYRSHRVSASSTEEARSLVREAWIAGRRVALKGRQEVRMPGRSDTPLEVEAEVETSREGDVRIHYLTEPLKGVTIWENDDKTYRYNPRLGRLTVAQRRHSEEALQHQEERVLDNYDARVVSRDQKVANRNATVIELRPRAGGDRWKRIWVDNATRVILRSEDLKDTGTVLRSTHFTEVEYFGPNEGPDGHQFRPSDELIRKFGSAQPGDNSSRFELSTLSTLVGFRVLEPKWLPAGYSFRGGYQTPCSCPKRHQAARLEYSDGLNTLSLFECAHPECISKDNCFTSGESGPMAFRLRKDGVSYLGIGDLKRADLERFVRSAAP